MWPSSSERRPLLLASLTGLGSIVFTVIPSSQPDPRTSVSGMSATPRDSGARTDLLLLAVGPGDEGGAGAEDRGADDEQGDERAAAGVVARGRRDGLLARLGCRYVLVDDAVA